MSEPFDIGQHRDSSDNQVPGNQQRGCLIGAIIVVVLAGIGIAIGTSGGDGESGPVLLTHSDEQTLAKDLARATDYQNICYGWQLALQDNYSGHSGTTVGSNQGGSRPLDTGKCDRWVELRASITWTSNSSSSPDFGRYTIRASPDLTSKLPNTNQLERIGFSQKEVVNNPSVAVENLMEGLPLLMAENDAAKPLPVKEKAKPSESAAQPVDVNSDKWRNHKGMLIFGSIAILGAIACLIVGVVVWRRRRGDHGRGGPAGPGGPSGPAGPDGPDDPWGPEPPTPPVGFDRPGYPPHEPPYERGPTQHGRQPGQSPQQYPNRPPEP